MTYAAIFGNDPGAEVAASLKRLDLYLQGKVTTSTAAMLCIMLRPIDLYALVLTAAERQLHNANLMLGNEVTAMRSSEALVIAHQNATISRLTHENDILRHSIARIQLHPHGGARASFLMALAALIACAGIIAFLVEKSG